MLKILIKYTSLLLILVVVSSAYGQKKVKLKRADQLIGGVDKDGKRFDRFLGDVVFEQNETTIYCDSAILYKKENLIRAYGHVRITEGDSVTITAKTLVYTGDNKKAKLRKNVIFNKLKQVTLYTDFLDYDRLRQEARYFKGEN